MNLKFINYYIPTHFGSIIVIFPGLKAREGDNNSLKEKLI